MRHHRLAWIAAAAALTTAPFSTVPASAAAPVSARAVAPADVATPTVAKHVVTDVDGDGTRDSVTLTYLGANQFTLTTTTTKGKSSSVSFTSVVDPTFATPASSWYGASAIDGRKGSELIVNRFTTATAESGENVTLGVYTWRSGKLVAEKAPASWWGRTWKGNANQATTGRGYRFFTSHGHRYVDATRMYTLHHRTDPWYGTFTRSVWRHGTWVRLWTRKAKTVKDYVHLWSQDGVGGPKLLLGQVSVDISGDGAADLVSVYQDKLVSHFVLTAIVDGSAVKVRYLADDNGFIGAAAIDGVAGDELIVQVNSEEPSWRVLTWRAGRLVDLSGPYLPGETEPGWLGETEDSTVNYATSFTDGVHSIVVGEHWADGAYNFVTSKWDNGGWVKVSEESKASLTAEEQAKFHTGFTAADLITP
jgi:hypothetical protein